MSGYVRSPEQYGEFHKKEELKKKEWDFVIEQDKLLKPCISCIHVHKHSKYTKVPYQIWKCLHPENVLSLSVNIISLDLERTYKHQSCLEARAEGATCGKEGNWFESESEYWDSIKKPPVPTIGGAKATEIIFDEIELNARAKAAADKIAALKSKKRLSDKDLQNL